MTDDKDRLLLITLLEKCCCQEVVSIPRHKLSPSGLYYAPEQGTHQDYLKYALPCCSVPCILMVLPLSWVVLTFSCIFSHSLASTASAGTLLQTAPGFTLQLVKSALYHGTPSSPRLAMLDGLKSGTGNAGT